MSDRSYQGVCYVCDWEGASHDNQVAAEEEAAEHAGYCSAMKAKEA